jgi:predicted metal-dependent enzyme (double-stranded beta helix superfamily)
MQNRSTENLQTSALDAVAAAPHHHRIIFENEQVRVLDAIIGPGDTVPVHTHEWPSVVYTLQTSDFVRFNAVTGETLDSRESWDSIPLNKPINLPPLTAHSIRNVGDRTMRAISVELKNQGEK